MRLAGISEGVAMQISGHKTRAIFDRYDIKNEEDYRQAAEKIANLKGQPQKNWRRFHRTAPHMTLEELTHELENS